MFITDDKKDARLFLMSLMEEDKIPLPDEGAIESMSMSFDGLRL